jgi:hypothetical protein
MFNRIIQIGAGGTGAILAPLAARLFKYHNVTRRANYHLYDADKYESHNVNRQPVKTGAYKAKVVADQCRAQGLPIMPWHNYVDETVMNFLLGAGLKETIVFICAVDNDATRAVVLKALDAHLGDFLYVSPANADDEDGTAPIRGSVHWWARSATVELGINPATVYPNLINPSDQIPRVGSCTEQAASSPQLLAANAMAAASTLTFLQNFLDGQLNPHHHAYYFNAREPFSFRVV